MRGAELFEKGCLVGFLSFLAVGVGVGVFPDRRLDVGDVD